MAGDFRVETLVHQLDVGAGRQFSVSKARPSPSPKTLASLQTPHCFTSSPLSSFIDSPIAVSSCTPVNQIESKVKKHIFLHWHKY